MNRALHPSQASFPELSCDDVNQLMPIIADGTIDVATDPAVFAHLSRCDDCQEALARHDLITLAMAPQTGTSPDHSRRIVATICVCR